MLLLFLISNFEYWIDGEARSFVLLDIISNIQLEFSVISFVLCVILKTFVLNWWRKQKGTGMEEAEFQRAWNSEFTDWEDREEGS